MTYAERSRSRTFLDLLAWTELSINPSMAPQDAQHEAELRHALRNIALAQREAKAESVRRRLALQYSLVQEELQATLETIRETHPEYVALRRAVPVGFEEIREYLVNSPGPA